MQRRCYLHALRLSILLLIGLNIVACGKTSFSTDAPATVTPTNTPQITETPNATKGIQTPDTAEIALSLDKQEYHSGENIQVSIINHLTKPIFLSTYYTNCTVISLEQQVQSTWVRQGRCPTAAPHSKSLAAEAVLQQTLAPGKVTWAAGTYRVTLFYSLSPDQDSLQGQSVSSAEFSIKA